MLGVLSSIRHPQKNSFLDSFLDAAGRCYKNRLNQSANPSPLIREGPAQNVPAWSEHGPLMVGGMGRAALYLKVSPNGLWPAARSRPVAGFKGCRPVPPTPGVSCGFGATKNSALGFGFFGFF